MKNMSQILRRYPWIIPMLAAAVLIIGAARMHTLWGDEAETALFARNILKYGVPKGWDGVNIMGINNAVVLDKNLINHTSPWAQYYMVAASFKLLGQSSFAARVPSILLYIASIPLLYYFALKLTGKKRIALLSTIVSALSVQGILYGYQVRYYELTNVAGLLFVWAAISFLDGGIVPIFAFVLSGILFYYANYVSWSAFYIATLLATSVYMLVRSGKTGLKRYLIRYVLLTIPIAAVCLPWFLIMHPFGDRGTINIFPLLDTILSLRDFAIDAWRPFHTSGVLPIGIGLLVVLVLCIQLMRKQAKKEIIIFGLLPTIYLTIMMVYATISYVDTTFSSPRYTTVAILFFCVLVAWLVDRLLSWQKAVGIIVMVIYLTTNLFTFNQPRSFLYSLVSEIIAPYQTPEILVANFLKAHAKKGQTAFVNLDHDHEPLIFLLGDDHALRFVNRVDLVNTHIFPENRGVIPRYIYDFRDEPDFLIFYSKRPKDGTFFTMDYRQIWPEVDVEHDYVEHVIPVFFGDPSRPEMELRSFSTVLFPDPRDHVYVYEKKLNK